MINNDKQRKEPTIASQAEGREFESRLPLAEKQALTCRKRLFS